MPDAKVRPESLEEEIRRIRRRMPRRRRPVPAPRPGRSRLGAILPGAGRVGGFVQSGAARVVRMVAGGPRKRVRPESIEEEARRMRRRAK